MNEIYKVETYYLDDEGNMVEPEKNKEKYLCFSIQIKQRNAIIDMYLI